MEVCGLVGQGPRVHIYRQLVMRQEICAKIGYFHVGNSKSPGEIASHVNVQGECLSSVRIYCGTVGSLEFEQGELRGGVVLAWYHADGCTCVHKEF